VGGAGVIGRLRIWSPKMRSAWRFDVTHDGRLYEVGQIRGGIPLHRFVQAYPDAELTWEEWR